MPGSRGSLQRGRITVKRTAIGQIARFNTAINIQAKYLHQPIADDRHTAGYNEET
jgi:hypothetical protein